MNAFTKKKVIGTKIQEMTKSDWPDDFIEYFEHYLKLTKVNTDITNECGLKPIVLHICKVLTAKLKMKEVIVLQAKKEFDSKTTIYDCLYVETDEKL